MRRLIFLFFLFSPMFSLSASAEEYAEEIQTEISLRSLSYAEGNFNPLVERYADIPEFSWKQFSLRSTSLPSYDLRILGWKLVRDDAQAVGYFSLGSRFFTQWQLLGTPYNVNSKIGFRRWNTSGGLEWFPFSWLTLHFTSSEEDKTGARSPDSLVGQKSQVDALRLASNFSPFFFDVLIFQNQFSHTEFGNLLDTSRYSFQYLPNSSFSFEFSGGRGDLKSRSGLTDNLPADVDFDTISGSVSWQPLPSVQLNLDASSFDYNDKNSDSLNVESRRMGGSATYFFPSGLVRLSLSDEEKDFTGVDISHQDIESLELLARYHYKGLQLQIFHNREDRSTGGISDSALTNTEELARSSRITGTTLSGLIFRDVHFLYTLRFVENNYERITDTGVEVQKFRHQSFYVSYPVSLRASLYYTFSENAFLSRYRRLFTLAGGTQARGVQLVDDNEFHQFGVGYQFSERLLGDFSFSFSNSSAAEEFASNSVKSYEYASSLSYWLSPELSLSLDWIYDRYKDSLGLSPSAKVNFLQVNVKKKF
ncbi:MAG: hypothetical protein V2G33_02895 [bacterium JZ-2024 1]